MESNHISIKGMYRDVLKSGNDRTVFDSGWRSNTIVIGCRTLLAGFMRNEAAEGDGIRFLAVGQGNNNWDALWDTPNPPYPAPETVTQLEHIAGDPPIPVAPLSPTPGQEYLKLIYLDASDEPAAPGVVTSRLQIRATLQPGYPTSLGTSKIYPLREFGLFGSINGTEYMINCVRHPMIPKDESMTLMRVMRLYF
jgi:hypothetical protein